MRRRQPKPKRYGTDSIGNVMTWIGPGLIGTRMGIVLSSSTFRCERIIESTFASVAGQQKVCMCMCHCCTLIPGSSPGHFRGISGASCCCGFAHVLLLVASLLVRCMSGACPVHVRCMSGALCCAHSLAVDFDCVFVLLCVSGLWFVHAVVYVCCSLMRSPAFCCSRFCCGSLAVLCSVCVLRICLF